MASDREIALNGNGGRDSERQRSQHRTSEKKGAFHYVAP